MTGVEREPVPRLAWSEKTTKIAKRNARSERVRSRGAGDSSASSRSNDPMRCAAADASICGIMPTNSAARSVAVARKRDALLFCLLSEIVTRVMRRVSREFVLPA